MASASTYRTVDGFHRVDAKTSFTTFVPQVTSHMEYVIDVHWGCMVVFWYGKIVIFKLVEFFTCVVSITIHSQAPFGIGRWYIN